MGEIRCTPSPKAERNKKHFKWSVEFIFLSHLPINKSCTIFFCKQWLHSASIVSTSMCRLAGSCGPAELQGQGRGRAGLRTGSGAMVAALEVPTCKEAPRVAPGHSPALVIPRASPRQEG